MLGIRCSDTMGTWAQVHMLSTRLADANTGFRFRISDTQCVRASTADVNTRCLGLDTRRGVAHPLYPMHEYPSCR